MVLRLFLNVRLGWACEAVGDTYIARRELVVHGASNSFAGALLVE